MNLIPPGSTGLTPASPEVAKVLQPTEVAPPRPPIERKPLPPLARFHGVRRIGNKLRRRVQQLAGKPDNSPWVLDPKRPTSGQTYVDVIFGLDYVSPNSPLVKLMREAMGPYGLSVLPVNLSNVRAVTDQIQRGWMQPHLFLDLCSSVEPVFGDLATAAVNAGVYVVDDPRDLLEWTLKAPAQGRLEAAGLPVPPTVILPKGSPDRDLTPEERAKVGERVVIKPSLGYANRGVVVGVEPTRENIAKARDFDRKDDWLVQRMIRWTRHGNRAAYLRAYHLLGHRTLMWWARENGHDHYELCTWQDLRTYDLLPAVEIVDKIAALTGIDYFSSEIAITAEEGAGRFVLIDYINDQCDMDPEERPGTTPLPEPWVKWVCATLADFAWRRKHGLPTGERKTLTLF